MAHTPSTSNLHLVYVSRREAVFFPSFALATAKTKPALPPPIIVRSYSFILCLSSSTLQNLYWSNSGPGWTQTVQFSTSFRGLRLGVGTSAG